MTNTLRQSRGLFALTCRRLAGFEVVEMSSHRMTRLRQPPLATLIMLNVAE
jgi:hypothetical protein